MSVQCTRWNNRLTVRYSGHRSIVRQGSLFGSSAPISSTMSCSFVSFETDSRVGASSEPTFRTERGCHTPLGIQHQPATWEGHQDGEPRILAREMVWKELKRENVPQHLRNPSPQALPIMEGWVFSGTSTPEFHQGVHSCVCCGPFSLLHVQETD